MTRRTQETRTTKKTKINYVILLIGAVILFTAPLVHIELPKSNPYVKAYEAELDAEVAKIDQEIDLLYDNYETGKIDGDAAFTTLTKELIPKRKETLDENDELLSAKTDEERIFGWKNWRAFANGFGIRLPYLILALIISALIKANPPRERKLRWSYFFLQIICYTMAFYQMVYSFWPGQDIPLAAYRPLIFTIAALCSVGLTAFIEWYDFKISRLQMIARNLIGFTYSIEKEKGYIKEEKRPAYKKERTLLVRDSIENE